VTSSYRYHGYERRHPVAVVDVAVVVVVVDVEFDPFGILSCKTLMLKGQKQRGNAQGMLEQQP
jgi:hypothetical protein